MMREELLIRTFVELADAVAHDVDGVDVAHTLVERCQDLFEASACVMLTGGAGALAVLAASTDPRQFPLLFELRGQTGPSVDCVRVAEPIQVADLRRYGQRWPRYTRAAVEAGYRSVHAFPIQLRSEVIGVLELLRSEPGPLAPLDVVVAHAFADAAAMTIGQQRALRDAHQLATQLQRALESRVVIEQAKGMLAERAGISLAEAFGSMRTYSRTRNQRIALVSAAIVDGTLRAEDVGQLGRPGTRAGDPTPSS